MKSENLIQKRQPIQHENQQARREETVKNVLGLVVEPRREGLGGGTPLT